MKRLYLLVANIGAGKTTWAKRHITKNNVYLSCDSFRYLIGAGEYRFSEKTEAAVKQTIYNALHNFAQTDLDIIFDMAAAVSNTFRAKIASYIKPYGYEVIAVVLPKISMEKSVARRLKDPHGQFSKSKWEEVWKMFNDYYIEPNVESEPYLSNVMYVKNRS